MHGITSLSTALLVCFTTSLSASPVTLTGKNVRFILDDSQLTAFGGVTPTVKDDLLVFTPPAAQFRADAIATSSPVGYKTQAIEFSVEALGGQQLTAINLHISGLRSEQGTAPLSKTQAYGTLNAKDQFLVNRRVNFEGVDASNASWQAPTALPGLSTRKADISFAHSLRALALDNTGSASIDSQDGIGFSVATEPAQQADRVFDWAEATLDFLAVNQPQTATLTSNSGLQCNKKGEACSNLEGLRFRCYISAELCYGIKNDIGYVYHFAEQVVLSVGSIQPYFNQAVKSGF